MFPGKGDSYDELLKDAQDYYLEEEEKRLLASRDNSISKATGALKNTVLVWGTTVCNSVILEHKGVSEEGKGMVLKNVAGSRPRRAWDVRKVKEQLCC